jgi:hypothetical protein
VTSRRRETGNTKTKNTKTTNTKTRERTLARRAELQFGRNVSPRLSRQVHVADDLTAVSEAVAETEIWLVTHPEFRRDPKIRATADFLKRVASGPAGLGP